MPWELGYFDGMKPGHVGIVPIVASEDDTFPGQEYLGLYPHFGLIDIEAMGLRLAMDIDSRTARLIKSAVCIGTSRT
jgi:hypothetical protein